MPELGQRASVRDSVSANSCARSASMLSAMCETSATYMLSFHLVKPVTGTVGVSTGLQPGSADTVKG